MRNGQRVGPKTGSHSSLTCLAGVEEDRNKKKDPHKRNKKKKEKKNKKHNQHTAYLGFFPFTVIAGIFVMYGRGFCTSKELYCFSNK